MPYYDYECQDCEHRYAAFHSVAERNDESRCEKCGSNQSVRIIITGKVSVHTFTPHFSTGLGVWVKSRREETVIARSKGFEPVGDTPHHEVESETRRVHRQAKAAEDAKGPPEEFYRAYDDAMRE